MFFYTLLLILSLPVIEIFGLYWLSAKITIPGTLVWVLATGFFGATIARRQGLACWKELHERIDRREQPTETIMQGLLILLAGVLLILPGLLTDVIGCFLLIPLCRRWVIRYAADRFLLYRMRRNNGPVPDPAGREAVSGGDVDSPKRYDAKKDVLDV